MVPRALEKQHEHTTVSSANHLTIAGQNDRENLASSFFRWKRAVDLPLAALLLIPFGPVIGVLWILVKLGSPGPGFYRQKRVGQGGRPYMMFKLRSMRQDAEVATGAVWSTTNDPRVTRFGRFLRRFHLDELPQLVNVLKGDMSLVGPRPERPEFVEVLSQKIPDYDRRHLVRPGITGLAQLNLPPDTDLNSVRRKLILDLEYVERASAWTEARLLICTAARLFKVPAIKLFGLSRNPHLRLDDADFRQDDGVLAETVASALAQSTRRSSNGNGHASSHRHRNGHTPLPLSSKPR